ncbi:MAG: hemolysin family protein [bacterium]
MFIIMYLFELCGLVMLCAFFAGSETAITSLSLQTIHNLTDKKPSLVKPFKFWQKHPSHILTFLLIGSNGVNIAAGVLATAIALKMQNIFSFQTPVVFILVPGAVVFMMLMFGEIIPKIYGKKNAEAFLSKIAGLMIVGTRICTPIIWTLVFISDVFIRLFGGQKVYEPPFITSSELRNMFASEQSNVSQEVTRKERSNASVQVDVPEDTKRMLDNLVGFSRTRVEEIMVPRTKMFALDIKLGREKIMHEILDQRYSRVPIYESNMDNIIGVIYSKDLIASAENSDLIILHDLLRPVYYIPEMARVSDIMREFKTGKHHMAIVVDQYGGTAGLVTIEDVVEEIVGEIYDEFDEQESTMVRLDQGSYLVWASEDIDRINDELNLKLPEDQYETLAALVLDIFGKIPKAGETKKFGPYMFEVIEADRRRIYKIKINRITA